MNIDTVLFPITTLGPGQRLVIWTVGCSKHCKNCINPELWDSHSSKKLKMDDLKTIITRAFTSCRLDGVTITGGDPLEQLDELLTLLPFLKQYTSDVLLYTGFSYDIWKNTVPDDKIMILENCVAVLIDGQYIDENNDNRSALIGSTNQKILFFNSSVKPSYEAYLVKGRTIQNVYYGNKMISVGIHKKEGEKYACD